MERNQTNYIFEVLEAERLVIQDDLSEAINNYIGDGGALPKDITCAIQRLNLNTLSQRNFLKMLAGGHK